MGLISFLKETGEKLLGKSSSNDKATSNPVGAVQGVLDYVGNMGLAVNDLSLSFEPATSVMTVKGEAADKETKEKIILCVGNVEGVASVDDQMTCADNNEVVLSEDSSVGAGDSQFYQVKSGDNLSKIAKQFYGDANKYNVIFEANKPMLTSADKIYPGQTLRIPKI